jgi:hypothetical protein
MGNAGIIPQTRLTLFVGIGRPIVGCVPPYEVKGATCTNHCLEAALGIE